MVITHYDLFAGIGGFSLALEEVFNDATIRHIFCEWERFPTAVLRQHWPDGEFYGDIAELVTHTKHNGQLAAKGQHETSGMEQQSRRTKSQKRTIEPTRSDTGPFIPGFTIVTGGFPCQPFSHAGRRKGTADDRYQWPNMFAVIRNTSPEWVIAENVRGLVTWNDGLVLETVCTDLEGEGYEVQPFIIPAVAVGAPHRRDRIWIIAHRDSLSVVGRPGPRRIHTTDAGKTGADEDSSRRGQGKGGIGQKHESIRNDSERAYPDWRRNWQEVAFATCNDSVDDGLSRLVDGVPYSRAKWRKDSLKAYGNGIVPEVAMNIMQAIKASM